MGKYLYLFSIFLTISCSQSNEDPIQQIKTPTDYSQIFDTPNYGVIEYQLYKKYGFTDIVEQVIEIQKPSVPLKLKHKLPIDSATIQSLGLIDLRKLLPSFKINYLPEKVINSDIFLDVKEFSLNDFPVLSYEQGEYEIINTKNTRGIIIYDAQNELVYIEIKKR